MSYRYAIVAVCLASFAAAVCAPAETPATVERVRPWRYQDSFTRTGRADIGLDVSGDAVWTISGDEQASITANPFRLNGRMPSDTAGRDPVPGCIRFGTRDEARYIFDISAYIQSGQSGAVFALGNAQTIDSACRLRVQRHDERLVINVINANDRTTIHSPNGYSTSADSWLRFRLVSFDGTFFVSVDGVPLATLTADAPAAGRPAFLLASGEIALDDVSVTPAPLAFDFQSADSAKTAATLPVGHSPDIPKKHSIDRAMASWAAPSATWYKPTATAEGFISRQPYFNDASIVFEPQAAIIGTHTLGLNVNDWRAETQAMTGFFLDIDGQSTKETSLVLRSGNRVLAQTRLSFNAERIALNFRGSPAKIAVEADYATVLTFDINALEQVSRPLNYGRAYLKSAWMDGKSDAPAYVVSPNAVDDVFSNAATDWAPVAGHWDQMSLWQCLPRSAWYACDVPKSERLAANLFKRDLSGNFWIDVVIAFPMRGDQTPYYDFPLNFNISLLDPAGADALNDCLTFRFNGPDQTDALFRGEQLLSESNRGMIPGVRHSHGSITDNIHTTFFQVQLTGKDGKISAFLNGERILQMDDPQPDHRRKIVFWAVDNGVTFSRARISADELTPPADGIAHLSAETISAFETLARRVTYSTPDAQAFDSSLAILADWEERTFHHRTQTDDSVYSGTAECDAVVMTVGSETVGPFKLKVGDYGGYDGVIIAPSPDKNAEQRVRVINKNVGSPMEAVIIPQPFYINETPFISFDYRLPAGTSLGMVTTFGDDGGNSSILLIHHPLLEKQPQTRPPALIADGQLHRADIDLRTFTRGDREGLIRTVRLFCPGYEVNPRGAWFEIGDISLRTVAGETIKRVPQPRAVPAYPAPVIRIDYPDVLARADFNGDSRCFGELSERGGMSLYRMPFAGPDGTACVALEKERHGNGWESYVFLHRSPYSADDYPMIQFRYKLNPVMTAHDRQSGGMYFGCRIDREVYGIFDRYFKKGKELVEDSRGRFIADNTWRVALFDGRRLFKRYQSNWADRLIVEQLFLVTRTWQDGVRCAMIDDLVIFNPRAESLTAVWNHPADAEQIVGYAWSLTASEASDPGNAVNAPLNGKNEQTLELPAELLPSGETRWLSVRAIYKDGNASAVATEPVYRENKE